MSVPTTARQAGFKDETGNSSENWSYEARIQFEKSAERGSTHYRARKGPERLTTSALGLVTSSTRGQGRVVG
jgi:hypothetical protein